MVERILVWMPELLDDFLSAAAVVQDYWVQLWGQFRQGLRKELFQITVEMGSEDQFFLAPVFPRMEVMMREQDVLVRGQWDCVLDLRKKETALPIATSTKKNLAEAWGISVGSSPQRLPELGGLMKRANQNEIDVLIDEWIPDGKKIQEFFDLNYPEVRTEVSKVNGKRVSVTFETLSRARMYVGPRSGATALGSTMGKAIVECFPDDLPLWFLTKNSGPKYRAIYGEQFPVEIVWNAVEEVWLGMNGIEKEIYDLSPQQEMTIGA